MSERTTCDGNGRSLIQQGHGWRCPGCSACDVTAPIELPKTDRAVSVDVNTPTPRMDRKG